MALQGSTSPDISESLPIAFSGHSGGTDPEAFRPSDSQWDIGVGDQAFLLAASKAHPYKRQSAELSKQQLDTSKEAGEQTLNQWWLRSQTSWHRGAGISFYEPGSDEGATAHRFAEAIGVDVWTEGQLSLLHKMVPATGQAAGAGTASATSAVSVTAVVGKAQVAVLIHAGLITLVRDGQVNIAYSHKLTNVSNAVAVGSKVYIGHSLGIEVWNAATQIMSPVWTQPAGDSPRIGYAKSRLIATIGTKVYELPLAGGNLDTTTALYSHPDEGWTWTGMCDSPTAILLCGYSGSSGLVYRMTLDPGSNGASPKLAYPEQIAELPPGETVHSIFNYLGNYVALGTARGIRIGTFSEYYSTFSYGPLTVETSQPVLALSARDRFCYATVTAAIAGRSGVVRIDLSEQVAENRFAWSWDVLTPTSLPATSIAFVGNTGRVVLGLDSLGHYVQSPTLFEDFGQVVSGKLRFGTSEPKSFRLAMVRAQTNSALVTLFALSPSGDREVLSLSDATNTNDDIDISTSIANTEYASFRLVLQSGVGGTSSPVVESYTIKALPAPKRQRLIQYPLMCFDQEHDRYNTPHGFSGAAALRLAALEKLEEEQAVVLIQDFTNGESFQANIESIGYTRETSPQRGLKNFGGVIDLTVRKLQ